jgi:citrate synthase
MDNERFADALIARAFDRVLQAEAAARDAVSECEQGANDTVERAREERQRILDRAQARIVAIHARCTRVLEQASTAAAEARRAAAANFVAQLSDQARRQRALERLAASLTGNGAADQPSNAP